MSGKWKIGIIGGSGLYAIDALQGAEWGRVSTHMGRSFGRSAVRLDRRRRAGVPAASWPRPPHPAIGTQLPREHRCAEAQQLHRTSSPSPRSGRCARNCRPGISWWSTSSSTARSPAHRAPSAPAWSPMSRWRSRSVRRLSAFAAEAVTAAGGSIAKGATYLAMEGPQFSSRAESLLYREWGADVIGMTAMPESNT